MDRHRSAWISIDWHQVCIHEHGSVSTGVDRHGSAWLGMDRHGSAWICMDLHGSAVLYLSACEQALSWAGNLLIGHRSAVFKQATRVCIMQCTPTTRFAMATVVRTDSRHFMQAR
eukprot:TRINITY_DN780_c1_g1_i1.p1 TRINITY_DN780_c1_g1~~TRINITY_DN780_c1_g1_i1.p1  ORF type:complete len:115 (-),score=6.57 TRINITY_DN780_c1_g1_i1:299-643(-)